MIETYFWTKKSHREDIVEFVKDKLLPGVYIPLGNQRERERESKQRVPRSHRNKLAVSCKGMGGETEMDTHIPAKSRRWVEAYCLPWPFSPLSSAADQ